MDTIRESSSRSRRPRTRTASRGGGPPAALWAFLAVLALVFAGSYALGAAVGPVGREDRPSPADAPRVPEHVHGGEHR